MPAPQLQAHQQLDRAADRCYRPEPFPSGWRRVEYFFALYERLTAPLVAAAKPALWDSAGDSAHFSIAQRRMAE